MKKARFTDEQIIGMLKEADAGKKIEDICRQQKVSTFTFYKWRRKFRGMEVEDAKKMREMEAENAKLKKARCQPFPRQYGFEGRTRKKVKRPRERKKLAIESIAKFRIRARRACRIFGLNRFTWHYRSKPDRNVDLRARIVELASTQPYGCQMIHDTIRNEWPTSVNHKRTERIYREEGLLLKKRKKNEKLRLVRQPLAIPTSQDDVWAMDFIFDRLACGRQLKVLTMTDQFSKLIPDLFVAHSIRGADVVCVLDRLGKAGRKPKTIVVDNGSEFRSKAVAKWARDHGVKLHFIEPGKPQQNAFIESFNSRFRAECLEQNLLKRSTKLDFSSRGGRATMKISDRTLPWAVFLRPNSFAETRPERELSSGLVKGGTSRPSDELCVIGQGQDENGSGGVFRSRCGFRPGFETESGALVYRDSTDRLAGTGAGDSGGPVVKLLADNTYSIIGLISRGGPLPGSSNNTNICSDITKGFARDWVEKSRCMYVNSKPADPTLCGSH